MEEGQRRGAIHLKSNVSFVMPKGSTIKFKIAARNVLHIQCGGVGYVESHYHLIGWRESRIGLFARQPQNLVVVFGENHGSHVAMSPAWDYRDQAERDLPVRQRGLSTDIVLVRVTGFRFSVPSRVFMYPSGIRTRLLSQYDAMNSTAHPRLGVAYIGRKLPL